MKKGKVIPALLFVFRFHLPEVIEPAVSDFYNPSSWFSIWMFPVWIIFLFGEIFSSWTNMRYISCFCDCFVHFRSDKSSIKTEMFILIIRGLKYLGKKKRLGELWIMSIRSCHDDGQWDAIFVYLKHSFDSIFFPCRLDSCRHLHFREETCSCFNQHSAIPKLYLSYHRIP